jgi:hypothetical protein
MCVTVWRRYGCFFFSFNPFFHLRLTRGNVIGILLPFVLATLNSTKRGWRLRGNSSPFCLKVRFHYHIVKKIWTNSLTNSPHKKMSYILVLLVEQKFVANQIGLPPSHWVNFVSEFDCKFIAIMWWWKRIFTYKFSSSPTRTQKIICHPDNSAWKEKRNEETFNLNASYSSYHFVGKLIHLEIVYHVLLIAE